MNSFYFLPMLALSQNCFEVLTWRIRNAILPQSEVQIKSKMAAPLGRHATFGLIKMPFECLSNQLGFFILHPPKVKGR